MTTPEQRAELLELAEKATPPPGDWQYRLMKKRGPCVFFRNEPFGGNNHLFEEGCCWGGDTAVYIAAACNLAPALAREVEERTAERDSLGEFIQELYQRLPVGAQYIMLTFGKEKGVLK